MAGEKFQIKNENSWDTLVIAAGQELKVGVRLFQGPRTVLMNGDETEVAEPVWNGEYPIEDGRILCVVDGIIQEIKDAAAPVASIKVRAEKARTTVYRGKK